MYRVHPFVVDDRDEIRAFVEQYPFATLVATDPTGTFVATHLPLLVESWGEEMVLRGHIMRGTDHERALAQGARVLVSFLGPDAPILGSWQVAPPFGGTWNYQAVHAQGVIALRDQAMLVQHLEQLKNRFETSPEHVFSSLPADYISALLPMIQCIDVVVSEVECIFKLSQNRCQEDFDRTVAGLRAAGGKAALVAEEMQKYRPRHDAGH